MGFKSLGGGDRALIIPLVLEERAIHPRASMPSETRQPVRVCLSFLFLISDHAPSLSDTLRSAVPNLGSPRHSWTAIPRSLSVSAQGFWELQSRTPPEWSKVRNRLI